MNPIRRNDNSEHPMRRFQDNMGGMMRQFFNDPFFWNDDFIDEHSGFSPALNVEEKNDHFVIEAEVPGIDAKDIDIEVHGNMLTMRGERRREEEHKDDNRRMHRMESSYGSFQRSFTLPDNANLDEISADSKHGVLYINIPKDEGSGPRRIDIRDHNQEH